jgi:hypothetical protein
MSAKDNWDDSSDDEEGDAPDPLYNANGDAPPDPLYETNEEYHEVQYTDVPKEPDEEDEFVDAKESEERGFTSDEDWGEDDDYEDELDAYDRKLGRYVSCK